MTDKTGDQRPTKWASKKKLPPLNLRDQAAYSKEDWDELVEEWRRREPAILEEVADLRAAFPGAKLVFIGPEGRAHEAFQSPLRRRAAVSTSREYDPSDPN